MILPDYLQQGLDVVFCGTAAGDRSALKGHYYAGPGNKFWRILHDTGLTPKRLTPEEDAHVASYHIGLTDLVKFHSGNDSTLRREMYDVAGFERRILDHAPRYIAFNGRKGAAVYFDLSKTSDVRIGLQERTIGQTKIFVLPSTSGSANGSWDDKPWHVLASLI